MARTGIIGGSGLYAIEGMTHLDEIRIETPFGQPSDAFSIGEFMGHEVVFLPRHGRGHTLLPTEVNYRANIWGFKNLDVSSILSISAVGSLRSDYRPTDVVIIDNFFDRTNQARSSTFFGQGIVAHIAFAHPLCERLRRHLITAGRQTEQTIHDRGIYLNMEGPQFSTLAESQTFRQWGMDVIGMTQMSEARLAREAEMCYATMALVTDFDCWHEAETGGTVSVEMIMNYMSRNTITAKEIIRRTLPLLTNEDDCTCHHALAGAIITDRSFWPENTLTNLKPILKKYI